MLFRDLLERVIGVNVYLHVAKRPDYDLRWALDQIVKVGKLIDREEVKERNDVEKTFESVNVSSERIGNDEHAEDSIDVNGKTDKEENNIKLYNKVVIEFEAKDMATEDSVSTTGVCNSDHSIEQTSEPFNPNILSRPKRNIRAWLVLRVDVST
ncbi:hypothetical protein ILUMI_21037 [Ignelater luminosus]|uniref:Uncharacterized protein n=1 Tax=Ignelater luminosus TaxID=2038154 RepID=A0A8K0FYC5_IGNLU|nr:hypothetical protein ILUMI_21037 [Ignelater luminosus]